MCGVETEKIIGRGKGFVAVEMPLTPRTKRLIELAWDEARHLDHNYIGPEHLLLALIREGEGVAVRVLENLGVDLKDLRSSVMRLLGEAGAPSAVSATEAAETSQNAPEIKGKEPDTTESEPESQGFDRFSDKAIKVIMLAQEEARRSGHNFIGTEQILLGLIGEGTGVAAKTLKSMGANLKDARIETERIIGRGNVHVSVEIPFTPESKQLLQRSWIEAKNLGHSRIDTEHLLLALIHEDDHVALQVLERLGIDLVKVRAHVWRLIGHIPAPLAVPTTASEERNQDIPERVSFERFCQKALKAIMLAQEESRRLGHSYVGTEQILLGLIGQGSGIAAKALKKNGVNLKDARIETEKMIGRGSGYVERELPLTPQAKRVLQLVWDEARYLGHNCIDTEHVLLALIALNDGAALQILTNLDVDLERLRSTTISMSAEDDAINALPATARSSNVENSPINGAFHRSSKHAIKVILQAQSLAKTMGHACVGTEHILLSLLLEGDGVAAQALKEAGVKFGGASNQVGKIRGRGEPVVARQIPYDARTHRVLELSWDEARIFGSSFVDTEHLLLGIIREDAGVAIQVLRNLNVDTEKLRSSIMNLIEKNEALQAVAARDKEDSEDKTPDKFDFARLDDKSVQVLMLAQEEARRLGHSFVGTEQILLGLIGQGTSIAARALKGMGANLKIARIETEKIIGRGQGFVAVEVPFTPRAKRVLELSGDEANGRGLDRIAPEHILLALITAGDGVALQVLAKLGVDLEELRSTVLRRITDQGDSQQH